MSLQLSKEEATEFFSGFYDGQHHIPGNKLYRFGDGWYVNHGVGEVSTFDYNGLTKLVVLAHDKCMRVSISAKNQTLRIAIWKRQREGSYYQRHPDLESHISEIRLHTKPNETRLLQ